MQKWSKVLTLGLVLSTLVPGSVGAASTIGRYSNCDVNNRYSVRKVICGEEAQKILSSILNGKYDYEVITVPKENNTADKNSTPATPKTEEKGEAEAPKNTEKKEETAPIAPSDSEEKKETPAKQNTTDEQQSTNPNSKLNAFEQEVINLTNEERAKNGLAPLQANVELSLVARAKSQDMIDKNYFDHQSPTYGSPFDMMKSFGISYRTAGENIAKGQRTAEQVVNGWMNSEGHRKNILNANFTEIGVGYAVSQNGTPHWTQMFIGK